MAFLVKKAITLGSSSQIIRLIQTSPVHESSLRKWIWNASGFNKYGLYTDDLMDDTNADVIEAVRRLPQKYVDERNYRMIRACQLCIQKSILPKEEWTKYEEDVPYLQPYLKEVEEERREREEWARTH